MVAHDTSIRILVFRIFIGVPSSPPRCSTRPGECHRITYEKPQRGELNSSPMFIIIFVCTYLFPFPPRITFFHFFSFGKATQQKQTNRAKENNKLCFHSRGNIYIKFSANKLVNGVEALYVRQKDYIIMFFWDCEMANWFEYTLVMAYFRFWRAGMIGVSFYCNGRWIGCAAWR